MYEYILSVMSHCNDCSEENDGQWSLKMGYFRLYLEISTTYGWFLDQKLSYSADDTLKKNLGFLDQTLFRRKICF